VNDLRVVLVPEILRSHERHGGRSLRANCPGLCACLGEYVRSSCLITTGLRLEDRIAKNLFGTDSNETQFVSEPLVRGLDKKEDVYEF